MLFINQIIVDCIVYKLKVLIVHRFKCNKKANDSNLKEIPQDLSFKLKVTINGLSINFTLKTALKKLMVFAPFHSELVCWDANSRQK